MENKQKSSDEAHSEPLQQCNVSRSALSVKEQLWYDRILKYSKDYDQDNICSWWLRLEYDSENVKTATINYYLSKVAEKGYLRKETQKSFTRFSVSQICYKTNKTCKHDCHGLCRESC